MLRVQHTFAKDFAIKRISLFLDINRPRVRQTVGIHTRLAAQPAVLSEHGALGGRERGRFPHSSK